VAGVLFLTESFHPVLGGGETHIRALGAALLADGFRVTVVTRRTDAAWPARESLDGIEVLRVAPSGPGRLGKYGMVLPAVLALARAARGFELIVVRGTRVLGLPGLLAGRALGKRVVLQAEINGELSGEAYWWGTPLAASPVRTLVAALLAGRNRLLRDADAFVAMSRAIREEMVAAGVAPGRVHLLPHGVDLARFRPADAGERRALRAALGLPADALVIAYTGRLLRGKGLDVLLAAFREVAARRPQARLVVVGSGGGQPLSVEDALRQQARDLGDRVLFTGRMERVEDVLRAADVFAFPSEFEALGLSLIEAAACGLPAVGTRTGGIVDVIEDGASGLLVPPRDPGALAGALGRLADDADLRLRMGERGLAVARARFGAEESARRYRALFLELAAA
jgi:glycosyltransferase involved in cell wall biosynthesis